MFAAEEPSQTPRIIHKHTLSSKQALKDSSGSLKERTEEPLGNLKKV